HPDGDDHHRLALRITGRCAEPHGWIPHGATRSIGIWLSELPVMLPTSWLKRGVAGVYSVETATSMTQPMEGQSAEPSTFGSNVTSTPSSPKASASTAAVISSMSWFTIATRAPLRAPFDTEL